MRRDARGSAEPVRPDCPPLSIAGEEVLLESEAGVLKAAHFNKWPAFAGRVPADEDEPEDELPTEG